MNLISQILQKKRQKSTCALIPFITAGYPSLETTLKALYTLDQKGADIIELGIPYSDALADGPIIQESSKVALQQGVYIDQVFNLLSQINPKLTAPIVIFTYYNPVLVRGIDRFIKEISYLGVKGLIIPDLPIEETDYLNYLCSKYNIELILFIAPTSSMDRITSILSKAPGCIYLVSGTGVTGIRKNVNYEISRLSSYIKSKTDKLVMLGFGISNSSQVSQISQWDIDGLVIGSAFVRILSNEVDSDDVSYLGSFCSQMKDSIVIKKTI
uniref:Tryptophan synthase alpha chain n=1 Tax=Alsidium seaforthii TaxID=2007182 RepID=A0A1Z1MD35_9FLOR|nr:Tryptophan synthase alpha subunit [Bryothamnion seaforthii]ARW63876.1 Tryptophan synthase alpha subunit [Bryothamnion seaforthii]